MEYAYLGRTGLKVSRVCLGTMNFGALASKADSFAIMDRALELGVQFFDTANIYGGQAGKGASEEIVGRWLAQDGARRRDQIVLATKVCGRMGEGVNDTNLSAYHIRQACDESLRRLKTDHIDLYQMHFYDRNTPWEELFQAMEQLMRAGKVLYLGSSNYPAWKIMQGNALAAQRHLMGLVSEQCQYSLAARGAEREVLPACRELGVGVIPYSPLGGGLLCGVLGKEAASEGRRSSPYMQERIDKDRPKLEAYETLCRDLGHAPAEVALAWTLANPAITAPIAGPRTVEQLEAAVAATELKLSEDTLTRLDEIWPGPGK